MVRPRKIKTVDYKPKITYFKPQGVPLKELENIEITIDELETLRLSSLENLSQEKSAKKMQIHQSTFQRTLTRAREKITDALVNGKSIKIQGGEYKMPKGNRTGPEGMGPRTGRGLGKCSGNSTGGFESDEIPRQRKRRGLKNGQGRGNSQEQIVKNNNLNDSNTLTDICKCPKCNHEEIHTKGVPCNKTKCPKCETLMTRN